MTNINKAAITIIILGMICAFSLPFAKATDKAWIEMPSEVTDSQQFKVILHIDDPDLQKYTKKVMGFFDNFGGDLYYLREGTKPGDYPEITYNGESTFTFDMLGKVQPEDYNRPSEFTITFRFTGDKDELIAKYPQLKEDYYFDGKIGYVTKNITINPVKFDMTIPDAPGKLNLDKSTWDYVDFYSGFGFQYVNWDDYYSDSRSYYGSIGRTVCMDPESMGAGKIYCFDPYFEPDKNTKLQDGSITLVDIPGVYYLYSTPSNYKKDDVNEKTGERGDMEDMYLQFRAVAKKGWLEYSGNVAKSGRIFVSEEENYISDSLSEMKSTIQSASFTPVRTSGKQQLSKYVSYIPDLKEDKTLRVWGTISDGDADPMPYADISVRIKGKNFFGNTTKDGDFSIPLTGLQLAEGEKEVNGTLYITLSYNRDGKNYYDVRYITAPGSNSYTKVWASKEFSIKDQQDAELHWKLDNIPSSDVHTSLSNLDDLRDEAVTYYHLSQAVEFALTKLKANIDYKLPVEVWVGNPDHKTYYSPPESYIFIAMSDSSYLSRNNPKNREYHEFSHHLMYAEYGEWPSGRSLPSTKNHDGYLNPSTADSYIEGFAEFMAMAMAKDAGDKQPTNYANYGNLENNYWPQHSRGYVEEFSVAGILWDLYDKESDRGDTVSLSMDDIWAVLKVKRADFYEYYKAFKAAYPTKADAIDKIFIAHGFFADPTVGNKKRDAFEGFKNSNNDPSYNQGEFFVDYGVQKSLNELKYSPGMVIGKSANYERLANRSSAVRLPNSYVQVADPEVRLYKIKVHFATPEDGTDYEYLSDVRQGLLYLAPLPDNIDAMITIEPYSQDYKASKPYTLAARDYRNQINLAPDSQGYFAQHDFDLKPTGKKLDPVVTFGAGKEPDYQYEGDIGNNLIQPKLVGDKMGRSGGLSPLFLVVLLLVAVGVVAVIFMSKGKAKKKGK